MRNQLAAITIILAFGAIAADIVDPETIDIAVLQKGMPADVAAAIPRMIRCHHLGGEDVYDAARRRELEKLSRQNRCKTITGDEAVLRKRYAGNTRVLERLRVVDAFSQ